jgi:hypothetical protein
MRRIDQSVESLAAVWTLQFRFPAATLIFPFAASDQHRGPGGVLVKGHRNLRELKLLEHKADWSSTCSVEVYNPGNFYFHSPICLYGLVLRHRDRCIHKNVKNMKNAVFWDVAPCRCCVNWRLGGTYLLHLQSRKIRERGTSLSRWLQPVPRSRIFLSWRWRRYVPPKRRFTQDLHGATSQKTAFFIVTAVKTSNRTCNE